MEQRGGWNNAWNKGGSSTGGAGSAGQPQVSLSEWNRRGDVLYHNAEQRYGESGYQCMVGTPVGGAWAGCIPSWNQPQAPNQHGQPPVQAPRPFQVTVQAKGLMSAMYEFGMDANPQRPIWKAWQPDPNMAATVAISAALMASDARARALIRFAAEDKAADLAIAAKIAADQREYKAADLAREQLQVRSQRISGTSSSGRGTSLLTWRSTGLTFRQ
eukprot:3906667-Heterocapsa_arctica.AAC.1